MDTITFLRPKTEDLWKTAVASLPQQDRDLYLQFPDKLQSIAELLKLADTAKEQCRQKAWRFKRRSGKEVIARDVLAKVVRWIHHFKDVGNNIVQYDPAHAALPWAGLRFILQICVDYFETHDFLLEKIPLIAEQICRCTLMENLLTFSPSATAGELRRALVKLHISRKLPEVHPPKLFQDDNADQLVGQVLQGLRRISLEFESNFTAIIMAQKDVEDCFQMASVQEQLDRFNDLKNAFTKLETPMNRWSCDLAMVTDTLNRSKRVEILQWISKEPYSKHHKREREGFLEGTGHWLLSNSTFKQWKDESASSILWLHGIPGSGKSKLTSVVIEDAQKAFQKGQGPPPAYFYCSRNPAEPGRSEPEKIIASIVRQLSSIGLGAERPLLEPTIMAYQSHEEEGFADDSLQMEDSRRLLLQLLDSYPTATIIIDALDECRADTRQKLLDCLEHILCESTTLVKIFVSSRDDHDIVHRLQTYPGLTLSSDMNSKDIIYFVKSETHSRVRKGDLLRASDMKMELSHKIIAVVSDGAQGMFRWASLQLDALCKLKSDAAVLERLGRLPDTLEKLYEELVDEIRGYYAVSDRQYATNALAWLLCGRRRLSSTEFLAAVSIIPGRPTSTLNKDQVLDLCHNLIVFDSILDNFRFAHLSVREFLETKEEYSSSNINSLAAECCLVSLLSPGKPDLLKDCLGGYSHTTPCRQTSYLESYANIYWAPHCQDATDKRRTGHLCALMEAFLSGTAPDSPFGKWTNTIERKVKEIYYSDNSTYKKLRRCESKNPSKILVASAFNFTEVVQGQLGKGHPAEGWNLSICMVIAALHGCYETLSALLEFEKIQITEEVIKTAAGAEMIGKDLLALVLEKRGNQFQITQDVLKAAAGNKESGKEVMALLLEEKGDQIRITEDVVKAAAKNYKSGKGVMLLLLEKRGHQGHITQNVLISIVENFDVNVITLLFEKMGDLVHITEDVVKAAAGNYESGKEVMQLLLEKKEDQVQITEEVVKVAAGNYYSGKEVMELLLEKRGKQVQITHEVVLAAAGNRVRANEIMALLHEKRGNEVQVTQDVVKAAAASDVGGKEVLTLLLEKWGDHVHITEEVVEAAVGNEGSGEEAMALLLEKRGYEIQITEDVVKAAAGNRVSGNEAMMLLLEKRGHQGRITQNVLIRIVENFDFNVITLLLEKMGERVQITKDVVKAAAGNYKCGKEVLEVLLEKREDQFQITEDVVKAAAINHKSGNEVMKLFLEKSGAQVQITQDVVEAAAQTYTMDKAVTELILERKEDQFQVTESMVTTIAKSFDGSVIKLLFEKKKDQVRITEDVVKAAAGNFEYGREVMAMLLEKRGDEVKITEDVVKAAAGNYVSGKDVIELLLEKRGDQVQITEDVIKTLGGNKGLGEEILALLLLQRQQDVVIHFNEALCDIAAANGQHGILRLLSGYGGLSTKTKWHDIATFYNATNTGDLETITQLLLRGVNPDTRDIRNLTPLWIAASNHYHNIVAHLVQRTDVNVNSRSLLGRPPIFWPAAYGDAEMVGILLGAGADPNIRDEVGESPISMARKNGHRKVLKLFNNL